MGPGQWLDGDDAEAVRRAADNLAAQLRDDPHLNGLPMWHDDLLSDGPLVVAYSVNLDDCLVDVWDVWHR